MEMKFKEALNSGISFFRETTRSYKFSAFAWFAFAFVVYYTVLKVAGFSAAAGYVENSVRPFLKDTVAAIHDIQAQDSDVDEIYSIRYLKAWKKWNLKHLEDLKSRALIIEDEGRRLEIQDQIHDFRNQNDLISSRIDELDRLAQKIENDNAILVDDLQAEYFILAYIPDLIDRHFDEQKASEYSVERSDGFFTGGMIINKMFVTHWLWYAPFLISLFYVFLDMFQPKGKGREPNDADNPTDPPEKPKNKQGD